MKRIKRAVVALGLMLASAGAHAAEAPPAMVSSLQTAKVAPDADPGRVAVIRRFVEAYYTQGPAAARPYVTAYLSDTLQYMQAELPAPSCTVLTIEDWVVTDYTVPEQTKQRGVRLRGSCADKAFGFGFLMPDGLIDQIFNTELAPPAVAI
jgi:hypothetical protein